MQPAATFKPEVASLNMGSMNFGLYHLLDKYKNFKYDWEKPHLEATRDLVFRNTFKDIEFILQTCYDNGTRFEFECYDIAHLYNLAHFVDRGLVKPPLLRAVGVRHPGRHRHPSGRRDAHEAHGRPAVRRQVPLVGAGRGRSQLRDRRAGGGDGRQRPRRASRIRLWAGRGKLAKSNAEQVASPARSSRGSAWRSRRRTRRARSSSSRAATRSPSEERQAMLRIEVFSETATPLGEGPLWDVEEQRLYWIDTYGPAVHSCDAAAETQRAGACRSPSARWPCARRAAPSSRCATASTRSTSRRAT